MSQLAYVGIGANLGDAKASVEGAIRALARVPRSELTGRSSLYKTAPVDATGPDFINAVAVLRTELSPHELLHELQAIENEAGRERPYRNAPRTLDLDLLMVDDVLLDTPDLTLPHPRMHQRAFVLVPLAEIAPDKVPSAFLASVADQPIARL